MGRHLTLDGITLHVTPSAVSLIPPAGYSLSACPVLTFDAGTAAAIARDLLEARGSLLEFPRTLAVDSDPLVAQLELRAASERDLDLFLRSTTLVPLRNVSFRELLEIRLRLGF